MAAGGKTVVMCTHLLLEAEGLADQVVMMEDGTDVIAGAADELMRRYWPRPDGRLRRRGPGRARPARAAWTVSSATAADDGDRAEVAVDDLHRVPDLVAALAAAGVRLTR